MSFLFSHLHDHQRDKSLSAKQRGNAHYAKKEYDQAIKEYTKAIELYGNDHSYYSNRSACYAATGNFEKALVDGKKCVELKPDWAKGYGRVGYALFKLNKLDEAKKVYEDGLKMDSNNPMLKNGLAECENTMNEPQNKGLFGPQIWQTISLDPELRPFLNDQDFVAKINMLNANTQMAMQMGVLNDPKIKKAFEKLMGMSFGDIGVDNDNDGNDENDNKDEDAEPTPEPQPEPELTEEEKKEREYEKNTHLVQVMTEETHKLKEENNNHLERINELTAQNMDFKQQIASYQKKMAENEQIIMDLTNSLDAAQKLKEKERLELIQRNKEIQMNLTDLLLEKEKIESERNESIQDVKQLQQTNIVLTEKINNLKQQIGNIDDEKKNDDKSDKDEICRLKFKNWLFDTVKLKQYLSNFQENECDDIRMIEFFEEDVIKNDIGINKMFHCKLIMKQANDLKQLQLDFGNMLDNNKGLKQYKQIFQANGILTLQDLENDIKTKQELGRMLKIMNENRLNLLWTIFHPNNDQMDVAKANNEGQMTEYH